MSRITGGILRGRTVRVPVAEGVRPTSDRVREALFSILGQDLSGERILDAFGGTGLLGLEAFSRGAQVTITEIGRRAFQDIVLRRDQLGLSAGQVAVECADPLLLTTPIGEFTGVIADPPWDLPVEPILGALAHRATRWLVLEAEEKTTCPQAFSGMELVKMRTYGRTALWFYRRPDAE